ncbi:DUF1329 domain-containing protein [Burkholderia sp. MR1-5-21]
MKLRKSTMTLMALGLASFNAWPVTPTDVAKLGQELTAVGAEKAGSKDGEIPAFSGQSKPTGAWTYGKQREDFWQHKDEKPLFVIDASNVDKYKDKLTPGQIQLLKQVKGYTMPVYPSHRDCGVPEQVADNTKASAIKSSIAKNGWSLENAVLPGIPFPVPETGVEAVWNFLMRYEGVGNSYSESQTYVSPRPGSSQPIVVRWSELNYFPWAQKGQHSPQDDGGLQWGTYYLYSDPAALAGQGTIQRYYYNKDVDTWYYFTGQRRVRRLPAYAYDAPLIGFENQYPADMAFIFSGNPDRFDWKLVGKKEVYIPYNGFAMQRTGKKLSDATGEKFINPAYRRYELHRVWEVVGTVKTGMRHSTPKKVLYLDEDSWIAAVGDDYDAQGNIWKAKESYITPEWDLGACSMSANVFNDLISGRYIFDFSSVGAQKDIRFFVPGDHDPRLTDNFFTGENLQTISAQ